MFFRTRAELKQAYAQELKASGRSVSIDVPVGDHGSVDILTDQEIIFCVLELNEHSVTQLRSQLDFYGRFSPSWEKVVVTQQINDLNAAAVLANHNIKVINFSSLNFSRSVSDVAYEDASKQQTITPLEVVYRYPKLDSVEGGDGLRAVIAAMGMVFLLGTAITIFQS